MDRAFPLQTKGPGAKLRNSPAAVNRILLLSTLILAGCHAGPKPPAATPTGKNEPMRVHTAKVIEKKESSQLIMTGSVTSQYSVNVTTDTSGRVTDMLVDLGDSVTKGQLLFRLDTTNAERQMGVDRANLNEAVSKLGMENPHSPMIPRGEVPSVQKAKSVLDDAYQTYADYLSLREEDLVSDMQLSNQRREYLSAKADYETALLQVNQNLAAVRTAQATLAQHRETLAQSEVRSSMDGTVQERLISPGDSVQQGQKSGLVIVGGEIYVNLDVPQHHLSQLSAGRSVQVVSEAYPNRKVSAVVANISPVANPRTGTVTIKARVDRGVRWLLPGLTVKARLQTSSSQTRLLVPEEAVLSISGMSQVFTLKNGRIHGVPVTLGDDNNENQVIVTGNLKAGDVVVVSDLTAMKEGDQVEALP